MGLSELPIEILWIIASYLPSQRNIYALVKTNCRLHQSLEKYLLYWNAQYNHGSALLFAVKHSGLVPQIRTILVVLDIARTRPHSTRMLSPRKAKRYTDDDSNEEEESSDEDLCLRRMIGRGMIRRGFLNTTNPYWADVYTHPLLLQKYCIPTTLNIQHALVVGIQTRNTEAIEALLQFGAEVNFYRGRRAGEPFSKHRGRRWRSDSLDIDDPPLFMAVQYGNLEIVNKLLECGADPQRYTPSPLYRAVEDGRRDLISTLLKRDVRSQKAALKLAVLRGDYSMVEFLLSAGLSASEHGHAGLYAAEMKGNEGITTLLKLHGATVDALSEADKIKWEKDDKDETYRLRFYRSCFLVADGN